VDIYQVITDRIIQALENGVKPWSCPWDKANKFNSLPMSLHSGVAYSGINIMLLWSETLERGFKSPYWLTYQQAVEMGGNVMKGEKGTKIIFYRLLDVKNKADGKKEQIPMIKQFTVFNSDQIENINVPKCEMKSHATNYGFETNPSIDEQIHATGATIIHQGVDAFYSPSADKITLPLITRFNDSSDYYATAFHELAHWTGHKSRLDRDLQNAFGTKDYAFEELVAELGSAFCCADVGVTGEVQHENYIAGWLKKLNEDKRFIFKASSLASKAHKLILNNEVSVPHSKIMTV